MRRINIIIKPFSLADYNKGEGFKITPDLLISH